MAPCHQSTVESGPKAWHGANLSVRRPGSPKKKWRRRPLLPLARHSPSSRNPSGLPFPCGIKPSSRLRVEQSGWQVRRAPAMLVVRRAPTAAGAAPHQSPTAGARSTTSQPCSATARRRQRCGSPGAMTIQDGGISSATMLG